jgi:catechol 2,3-dioxygenase-like lactoylglutathione lyase family enzyme
MLSGHTLRAFLLTARPDEAQRFYADVLGFPFVGDHGFALVFEAGGTRLFLHKVDAFTPHQATSLGWAVADLRANVAALKAKGLLMERYPTMQQDADGIWTPPGSQSGVAWFKDPDGNVLSLTQIS